VEDFAIGKNPYYEQVGPDAFKSQYERQVGGSTWAWRGNTPRFVPNDFRLQSRYGHGVDWPISYDDLESYYCDAEDALGVAADHREWNGLAGAHRSRPFPMTRIAQTYGDQQLKRALRGARFDGVDIRILALPQARNSRRYDDRPACHGNSNCIPICPIQAKYDATVHVKKALAAKQKATLIERAVVTELKTNSGGQISEVVYLTWDKQAHSVTAKIVVLAAHSIESAKILLFSRGGQGIANSSDQVGRNLMDHIGGEGAALMPFPVFPFRGPQSTSSIEGFHDHKHRSNRSSFRLTIGNDGWGRTKHPYDTLRDLLQQRLFGAELQHTLRDIVSRQLRIAYSTEQLPIADNRVTLSDAKDVLGIPKPKIAYSVDQYTLDGAAYAQQVIKHIFTTVGAAEEHWEFTNLQTRSYSGSGHIMGTCRMGSDPKTSVVDSECRAHEHKNLFLAGSAVFATSAAVNPTLTLAALALRTASAIGQQLKVG